MSKCFFIECEIPPTIYCDCKGEREYFCNNHIGRHSVFIERCDFKSFSLQISDMDSTMLTAKIQGEKAEIKRISNEMIAALSRTMKYMKGKTRMIEEEISGKEAELNQLQKMVASKVMAPEDYEKIKSFQENIQTVNTTFCEDILVVISQYFAEISQKVSKVPARKIQTPNVSHPLVIPFPLSPLPSLQPAVALKISGQTQVNPNSFIGCSIKLNENIGDFDISFLIVGESGAGKSAFINAITNVFYQRKVTDFLIAVRTKDFHITHSAFIDNLQLVSQGKSVKYYKFFNPLFFDKVLLFIEASAEILTDSNSYDMTKEILDKVKRLNAIIFLKRIEDTCTQKVANAIQVIFTLAVSLKMANLFVVDTFFILGAQRLGLDNLKIPIRYRGKVNNGMFDLDSAQLSQPKKLKKYSTDWEKSQKLVKKIITKTLSSN